MNLNDRQAMVKEFRTAVRRINRLADKWNTRTGGLLPGDTYRLEKVARMLADIADEIVTQTRY